MVSPGFILYPLKLIAELTTLDPIVVTKSELPIISLVGNPIISSGSTVLNGSCK